MLSISKRKDFIIKAFYFFLIILNTYVIIGFFIALYIWNQFNFVNIKVIEPINYVADNIDNIEATTRKF